ncbi:PREDICTED: exocyst complex component 5-like [Priapulus caudatus]|uniref:Exocyst complex component 5 n=1 Tax=Priapulus caudatus TaxID=37621 RepID=A0ABM1E5C1_PRICU|nr:PREDICTED: exocyst complex component 5-like [Priapulus caudatus]
MSQYMVQYLQELEQEQYEPKEFVERLAWRTLRGSSGDEIDPDALQKTFQEAIYELQGMYENYEIKVSRLESQCKEEESRHHHHLMELQRGHQDAARDFQGLDGHINSVATKVLHLGDQLESVNIPRGRAVEAQRLMSYFDAFLRSGAPPSGGVFADAGRLHEAADVVQKLHLIAQELPADNEECITVYSQAGFFRNKRSVFAVIPPLCKDTSDLVQEIFALPESVMAKFVLNVYHGKLMEHIQAKLADNSNSEVYLRNLYDLYSQTVKLSAALSTVKMGNDSTFLPKLTKHIFSKHLDTYVSVELRFLREKCATILQRYYDSKNHQKKTIQSGGIYDLRRDLQRHIGGVETYGGETFLSEEVSINILQECKMALRRCQTLCNASELAGSAHQIVMVLDQYLCQEHLDYAIELALQAIPHDTWLPLFLAAILPAEPQQGPDTSDARCTSETKLDTGLDRSLNAQVGWVKYLLSSEQKKADFKPDGDRGLIANCTPACSKVVRFVDRLIETARDSLDGKNVEAALTELGVRLHRVIYEHLQQYQYNTVGG